MGAVTRERAVERITDLAARGLDLVSFWREASAVIQAAVPHDGGTCWYTLDPASLLVTSHYNDQMPELEHEWLADEYLQDDFVKLADVARSERGATTLHHETGGDPSRSPMYQRWIEPYGARQMMATGLRTRAGGIWGVATLYRFDGRDLFGEEDLESMRAVAAPLAEGARRGLLIGEARDPDGPDAPGLLVLSQDWSIESATPDAMRWLNELPDGNVDAGDLPSAVYAVAGRALRTARGTDSPGEVAFARVLSRAGRWMVLHGASLVTDGEPRAAIIIEPAHGSRISQLLMAAHGLTDREQEITRLVLQGHSTTEIATQLFISAHTVQEHLKSIFDKTGVRSRRELVGKVFFSHYEPRVRDNEGRLEREEPYRGGPMSPPPSTP